MLCPLEERSQSLRRRKLCATFRRPPFVVKFVDSLDWHPIIGGLSRTLRPLLPLFMTSPKGDIVNFIGGYQQTRPSELLNITCVRLRCCPCLIFPFPSSFTQMPVMSASEPYYLSAKAYMNMSLPMLVER